MTSIKDLTEKLRTNTYMRSHIVLAIDLFASLLASLGVFSLIYIIIRTFILSTENMLAWLIGSVVASCISFLYFKPYRAIIRYSTLREMGSIALATLGKEFLLWMSMILFSTLSYSSRFLYGMIIIDFLFTLTILIMVRVAMMIIYDLLGGRITSNRNMRRVLVYGIGDKSASVVTRLRNSRHYDVVGFLTYGKTYHGHQLLGLPVYYFENVDDLSILAKKCSLNGVLFSTVTDARAEQSRLISFCHDAGIKTFITPSIDEVTPGSTPGNYVRNIKIEDLLGRPEIKISMDEIIANFKDKVVMVTGAAGSIGSELCRQLATFGVKKLILFDNAETPLHNIRLELEDKYPELNFVPVIGDVREKARLDFVFRKHHPQIVFQAAAYKHVPLMEENPCEAVHVNVVGSRQVADKCVEYDVEKMVMVSTDKAVNPTNIMGCTKRLAEIYVQSLGLAIERGDIKGRTKFVTTRFGNVLGSNGSVIPRFREQIEHGGPITVTHPEIRRFFMTIPEACRLVMEAATFATGTQIFVFDMGESVKISTLAERMVNLAGLEVGRDIKIEYTGLRPGEKLYEEVLATKENTLPTQHERIFVAKVRTYDYSGAREVAERLRDFAVRVEIPEMVKLMKVTVPEFKSKNSEFEIYDQHDAADESAH